MLVLPVDAFLTNPMQRRCHGRGRTRAGTSFYHLFAKPLRGHERAQARQLFRRFLDTTARVTLAEEGITVRLPRRAHNPLLLDAGLIDAPPAIPWWGGRPLRIEIV